MTNFSIDPTHLYTREEAAAFFGVKPNTLAVWASNKRYPLKYVKVGRLVRYLGDHMLQFMHNNIVGA